MKLAAIYNVFDGEEHLENSIRLIRDQCEYVIAVVQEVSNVGNNYEGGFNEVVRLHNAGLIDLMVYYRPVLTMNATYNETRKRNIGIGHARIIGATHCILLDCDEYWQDGLGQPDEAHRLYTYFPNGLRLEPPEEYYVPGILTIKPNLQVGNFNCGYYCDPTRKPNYKLTEGAKWMHHYSWVRNDLQRKIDNSSAAVNLQRHKDLIKEVQSVKDGSSLSIYPNKTLTRANHLYKKH